MGDEVGDESGAGGPEASWDGEPSGSDGEDCSLDDDCTQLGPIKHLGPIRASDDGRSLVNENGEPFLYIADTVWLAPFHLDQAGTRMLMNTRAGQGFTVLQMSVLPFLGYWGKYDNHYGSLPVEGTDLSAPIEVGERTHDETSPDYDYWDHVDYIISQAAERGLQLMLVPSWYGWQGANWRGFVNEQSARAYGTFLGDRLGHHPNIMWLHGGDNDPVEDTERVREGGSTGDVVVATRVMAEAIAESEPIPHIASYHASRTVGSLEHFAGDGWHTFASAYGNATTWDEVAEASGTGVPVIMTEAYYDDRNRNPILDERQLRAQGWWSLLGGAGYAYGSESIWDLRPGHGDDSGYGGTWVDYLDVPSAAHVQVMAETFAGHLPVRPDDAIVRSNLGGGEERIAAARAGAGDVAWIYLPVGGSVTVDLTALGGDLLATAWIDPRDGSQRNDTTHPAEGQLTLTAPGDFADAILRLQPM